MTGRLRALMVRLGGILTGRCRDRELDDELGSHLQLHIDDLVRSGMSPADARRAALLKFGAVESVKEDYRDRRGLPFLETLWTDLRFAARALRRTPSFTAIACLTLGLGIGATTAIFSTVKPILFDPLPYQNGRQLAMIWYAGADGSRVMQTFGTYGEVSARSHTLDALAVARSWQPTLTGVGEPERLDAQKVSAGFFHVLGVTPALGRQFQPAEDLPNGPAVAIISDSLWRRRFDGTNTILGRQIVLDGASVTVIGVMPRAFENVLAPTVEVWSPLKYDMSLGAAWGHHLRMIGRMRPGVSLDEARHELDGIARSPVSEFPRPPHASLAQGFIVSGLRDDVTSGVTPAFAAVLGAAIVLLAIACVNVTNLLLARSTQRRGEFAVRVSLGAGRGRLIRQLVTESLLLASIGGALGLLIASYGVQELIALSPPELPRVSAVGLSGGVFAFAAGMTVVVGLLVGLVSALHASRGNLQIEVRQSSSRATGGHRVTRQTLVVAEVALAIVLLVSAGLLLRSMQQLFAIDPGFEASHVLTMQVQTASRHFDKAATEQFFGQAQNAVRAVPGVTSAAFTSQLPLSGDKDEYGARFEGDDPNVGENVFRYAVTPGYIEAIGMPLRQGRLFASTDVGAAPPVALISDSLAKRKFAGRDPIGQHVRLGPPTAPACAIVGVVGDVKQVSLAASQPDAVYTLASQSWFVDTTMSLVVRTRGDAAAMAPAVKGAIRSVDPWLAVTRIATMDELLLTLAAERRFALILFEAFALGAVALAAIGIYGVLSGRVTERMREIGVRSALGASRMDILGLILRHGLTLTGLGVAIGVGGSVIASRWLVTLLFRVSQFDVVTYAGGVTVLVGIAVVACFIPAWRAARVDPIVTLRFE